MFDKLNSRKRRTIRVFPLLGCNKHNLEDLEKLFSCKVTLNKAEDSKDAKANKAKVGKPAILIE